MDSVHKVPMWAQHSTYCSIPQWHLPTHLRENSVLTFSFIPAPVPTKPEEYKNAVTRYWSICIGSASDTRSYLSVHDTKARYADGKKATFVVCLKKNPKLSDIQSKVNEMNANGEYVNLFI